eukprot:scaffold202685_cov20-Tisochrysis_lutea.AAC.1
MRPPIHCSSVSSGDPPAGCLRVCAMDVAAKTPDSELPVSSEDKSRKRRVASNCWRGVHITSWTVMVRTRSSGWCSSPPALMHMLSMEAITENMATLILER